LYLKLSQDAIATGISQIAPRVLAIGLNSLGQIPAGTTIYANDELTPSGTVYIASVIAPGGGLVYGPELLALIGTSPINLNSLIPTNVGGIVISFPSPVLQNPSAPQTITGQSLTLTNTAPLFVNSALTFANLISNSPSPAQSGNIRLASADAISWRNIGGTGDLSLSKNNLDQLVWPTGFIIANTIINSGGIISNYAGVNTVANGVPSEVAAVNLTAQTAAIATTTLFFLTPLFVASGQYRLSWNAKVTTAAGTSSTLGALTIVYTDPDGVVQTITAAALSHAGAVETTDTGNSTTTVLLGIPILMNCKVSTSITYAFAYASNAAAAMNYNLNLLLERI
jgi:hypothetical protein